MRETKIYSVKFNKYSNALNTTVYCKTKGKYIDIPEGGLLIKESDIGKYIEYGEGFQEMRYVGTLLEDDE